MVVESEIVDDDPIESYCLSKTKTMKPSPQIRCGLDCVFICKKKVKIIYKRTCGQMPNKRSVSDKHGNKI